MRKKDHAYAVFLDGLLPIRRKAFILKGAGGVGTRQLTYGQSLEGLRVAELSLALPVDGGHPHLVRRVGLQSRQHHRRWTETAEIG